MRRTKFRYKIDKDSMIWCYFMLIICVIAGLKGIYVLVGACSGLVIDYDRKFVEWRYDEKD